MSFDKGENNFWFTRFCQDLNRVRRLRWRRKFSSDVKRPLSNHEKSSPINFPDPRSISQQAMFSYPPSHDTWLSESQYQWVSQTSSKEKKNRHGMRQPGERKEKEEKRARENKRHSYAISRFSPFFSFAQAHAREKTPPLPRYPTNVFKCSRETYQPMNVVVNRNLFRSLTTEVKIALLFGERLFRSTIIEV